MPVLYSNSKVYSINYTGIGTVGGFFRFKDREGIFGISNNHVLANLNNCSVGDAVYTYGNKLLGTLYSWRVLNTHKPNLQDVCLFKLSDGVTHSWLPLPTGIEKPSSFAAPLINGHVYMLKQTGLRTGYINRQLTGVNNFYFHNAAGVEIALPFLGLFEIISFDGNAFSEPGDSGSLIFSSEGCIVGLLMGSQEHSAKSYFIPFDNILKTFPLIIA